MERKIGKEEEKTISIISSIPVKVSNEFAKEGNREVKYNIKDLRDREVWYIKLKCEMGSIIDISVRLERQITLLISNLLFGGVKNRIGKTPNFNKGEITFFEDYIFNTKHISFDSKRQIFSSLCKLHPFLIKCNIPKDLLSHIKKVGEWRNRFAHGDLAFSLLKGGVISEHVYLFYFYDNKPQKQILDNNFFEKELNPLFNETKEELGDLRDEINKIYESGEELDFKID